MGVITCLVNSESVFSESVLGDRCLVISED